MVTNHFSSSLVISTREIFLVNFNPVLRWCEVNSRLRYAVDHEFDIGEIKLLTVHMIESDVKRGPTLWNLLNDGVRVKPANCIELLDRLTKD